MSNSQMFFYNAHGNILGGEIRRPFSQVIETLAATSLPIIGGYASSQASDFSLKQVISFKNAYTTVSGSRKDGDGSYNTLVSMTIEGLNVLETVTADRVVARISSQYSPGEDETRVIFVGSKFENLQISGQPVDVVLDHDLFCQHDTSRTFKKRYQEDASFRKTVRKQFLWADLDENAPDFLKERYKWCTPETAMPESKGLLPCSLVKAAKHNCPEVKTFGNVLIVPQFGTIYLGEVLMKDNSRRLTMMRLDLGSPVEGRLTILSGEGNGCPYP